MELVLEVAMHTVAVVQEACQSSRDFLKNVRAAEVDTQECQRLRTMEAGTGALGDGPAGARKPQTKANFPQRDVSLVTIL